MKVKENKRKEEIRWGDIYTCDLGQNNGNVQGGVRPVLVIQDTVINVNSPTITVVAITSAIKKTYLRTHVVLDERCGLTKKSMVLFEQVHTVNKNKDLIKYVGHLKKEDVKAVKDALAYTMSTDRTEGILLRLCPKCREKMMKNPNCVIRRIRKKHDRKHLCDKCKREEGFSYLVATKRKADLSNM